jgi:signal transduction histidine kinase
MNSILGFIELIEDKDTSPENHQLFLSYINESSQHLLQTITSIIEISKIQERLVQVGSQTLHLNDLVELLASTARVEISEKNKPVTVETKCPLPVGGDSVSADRDKILLILSNLVTNSVNFTTRGSIEIGYRLTGSEVHFWVMDTGPGIAAERQNSLFTDFLQNSENTRISGEGSGLSLVLSSRLAKLLGGYLWLDRTGPGGSTFCLNIPIHPNSREGSS